MFIKEIIFAHQTCICLIKNTTAYKLIFWSNITIEMNCCCFFT